MLAPPSHENTRCYQGKEEKHGLEDVLSGIVIRQND